MNNFRLQALTVVALGSALGYLSATGLPDLSGTVRAHAAVKQDTPAETLLTGADDSKSNAATLPGVATLERRQHFVSA
jgi:hypothetical protein